MLSVRKLSLLHKHAKEMAKHSDYKFQLGAVLFKGSKILSTGYNTNKTHPGIMRYFRHARVHAEFDCILHAPDPEDLQGSSIFVLRTSKSGKHPIAKPCPLCVQVMKEYGIETVYWTVEEDPFFDFALIKDLYREVDRKLAYDYNLFPTRVDKLKRWLTSEQIFHG